MKILHTTVLLLTALLLSCNKDENLQTFLSPEQNQMQQAVIDLQNSSYQIWISMRNTVDSLVAVDSLLKFVEKSPEVSKAVKSSQGIMIQYKNGIRGGLFLNSERQDIDEISDYNSNLTGKSRLYKSAAAGASGPSNPRTAILCPAYDQFDLAVDNLLYDVDDYYKRIDFWEPERYFGSDATVEKFAFLENYGVVDIYTHGCAWPRETDIEEVYILTGEQVNGSTSARYWRYIRTGDIPLIQVSNNNYYWLSPEFIVNYSQFDQDTTLIFGGFCFSGLGSWPEKIIDASAGGYFCYNWSVYSSYSDTWENDLFNHLTDKSGPPISCSDWFGKTGLPTAYYDVKDNKTVKIMYYGDSDLTLWERENTFDYYSFIWQINGYLSNDLTKVVNIGGQIKSGDGMMNGKIFTSEDIKDLIYTSTDEVVIDRTGKLIVYLSDNESEIDSMFFELHERSPYYPDLDMTMRVFSLPRISYDESIPLSVFQAGGTAACGHIIDLTYKYGDNILESIECPHEWLDVLQITLSHTAD